MGASEEEQPHYNYDSDGEPPQDIVGDKLTIIKKQQVIKTIMEVGEMGTGKPGRPYIVKIQLIGYFAKQDEIEESKVGIGAPPNVNESHIRTPPDEIKEKGEQFVDHWEQPIQVTLGDERLPEGLWKSIEHMRKGEKARIMIKPKYGYNNPSNRDLVVIPKGWEEPEKN